jgi:hypothetical protein
VVDAAAGAAADLVDRLARAAAKLFRVGLYLTVHARTESELAAACAQDTAAAASTLIDVQPATWRHLAGWTTTLLATDSLQMVRGHPPLSRPLLRDLAATLNAGPGPHLSHASRQTS